MSTTPASFASRGLVRRRIVCNDSGYEGWPDLLDRVAARRRWALSDSESFVTRIPLVGASLCT